MEALSLSPEVLRWAADQAGESLESLARAMVKREGDRERVVRGELTPPQVRATARSADEYFTAVADRAEAAGVLVMKSGIVKSNTRRPLSVKEFRGFAIVDSLAPVVFINGRDALVASVFTLVHELAHVWLGESGVSDLATRAAKGVERVCNQVAAEVLVPKQEFLAQWRVQADLGRIARLFRVSKLVIARRALDFDLIDAAVYEAVASATNQPSREGGGGSAYRTIPARNSKRLTLALVRSALSGETLLREAASLLAVRPETVMELGKRMASRG